MSERKKVTFHVPAGADARYCLDCPQMVAFVKTEAGRWMPVDVPATHKVDPRPPNRAPRDGWYQTVAEFDGESHYATCPNAARFRK